MVRAKVFAQPIRKAKPSKAETEILEKSVADEEFWRLVRQAAIEYRLNPIAIDRYSKRLHGRQEKGYTQFVWQLYVIAKEHPLGFILSPPSENVRMVILEVVACHYPVIAELVSNRERPWSLEDPTYYYLASPA